MKLGLGTAQFGMNYGVTNAGGRVAAREVQAMLQLAAAQGLEVIDTAPAYGDAESALGASLRNRHQFKLVTKTLPLRMRKGPMNAAVFVRTNFMRSLQRLGQTSVYGLLVHDAEDLGDPDAATVIAALRELQREALIDKIGVSVYTGEQIDAAIALDIADIVQLPLNVLDQRLLASGHLARLKERGTEIHARSLFLQGLLLAPPESMPENLQGARPPLERFARWVASERMSPASAALAFADQLGMIDHAILGATSAAQLAELLRARAQSGQVARRFADLACDDPRVVDPSRWPQKAAG